jgi:aspartyl-tRNA(Asn)/glutamyl-tRNA(Gln) amidotransferase subunit A
MSGEELTYAPAWRLAKMIRARALSPVELTEHFLRRIDAYEGGLHAFITVAADLAMKAARTAESAVMRGDALGPLHGVPIAIKDLNATKGIRTTQGSLLHSDFVPDADDIPVERIRRAGALILGKTNTPEFGWKATTENLLGPACRNPWDPSRTPGGSSGGSAVALAAGLTPLALGGDAGGSIRIPASFSGVYGLKPSAGRVPASYEGSGGWRALSQNGPLANNVRDAAVLLQVLAGPDLRDALCLREAPPDFSTALETQSLKGVRMAWSPRLDDRPVDKEVESVTAAAISVFQDLGATVEEAVPEIHTECLIDVFATLLLTDMALSLAPALESGATGLLPPKLVRWVTEAAAWPATRFSSRLREREWHRQRMDAFFQRYDLLLTPTMATLPFSLEENPTVIDGEAVDPDWGFTPFLYPFNLSGQPAASIPCGFSSAGLPVGLQIVGGIGREWDVLRASGAFEAAAPWSNRRPRLTVPSPPE